LLIDKPALTTSASFGPRLPSGFLLTHARAHGHACAPTQEQCSVSQAPNPPFWGSGVSPELCEAPGVVAGYSHIKMCFFKVPLSKQNCSA